MTWENVVCRSILGDGGDEAARMRNAPVIQFKVLMGLGGLTE
jgi:hypothetical protein